ncbi:hypothetical protein [Andreprevotia chitinilytica]|uniref:hypothetical protein n=1 Tax=Andreprevotia chitinilytica TaxID=396808 RepID=UPI000558CBB6|nr:hypothetical protein [Andreprevotia chitinilytica]
MSSSEEKKRTEHATKDNSSGPRKTVKFNLQQPQSTPRANSNASHSPTHSPPLQSSSPSNQLSPMMSSSSQHSPPLQSMSSTSISSMQPLNLNANPSLEPSSMLSSSSSQISKPKTLSSSSLMPPPPPKASSLFMSSNANRPMRSLLPTSNLRAQSSQFMQPMQQESLQPQLQPQAPKLTPDEMMTAARSLTSAMHNTAKTDKEFNNFVIKGSTAMMVHGVNVQPGDIDMLVGSIPHAARAAKEMGYKAQPTAMKMRVEQEKSLPQVDMLHAEDWGEMQNLQDGRMMYGVRVRSREALLKDLRNDKRPEKSARNRNAIQTLETQAEREKHMQIVPYVKPPNEK